jgi:hypothetical protein
LKLDESSDAEEMKECEEDDMEDCFGEDEEDDGQS